MQTNISAFYILAAARHCLSHSGAPLFALRANTFKIEDAISPLFVAEAPLGLNRWPPFRFTFTTVKMGCFATP